MQIPLLAKRSFSFFSRLAQIALDLLRPLRAGEETPLNGRKVPPGNFAAPSTLLWPRKCFLLAPLEIMGLEERWGNPRCSAKKTWRVWRSRVDCEICLESVPWQWAISGGGNQIAYFLSQNGNKPTNLLEIINFNLLAYTCFKVSPLDFKGIMRGKGRGTRGRCQEARS